MANPRASNTDDFVGTDFSTEIRRNEKRWIGNAADPKPFSTDENTVPYGSTFYEQDTGRIARWDGFAWAYELDRSGDILAALTGILSVLNEIKELQAEQLNALA